MTLSRPVRITLLVSGATLLVLAIAIGVAIARFQPMAREYTINALRRQYHSDVTLGSLNISLFPTVKATGENLTFRLKGHPDMPPLMSIRRFTVETRLIGFFRTPRRIRRLRLEGLQIHVPPHGGAKTAPAASGRSAKAGDDALLLEEVIADGTTLETLPKDPAKEPLDFDIRELTLHDAGLHQAMTFHAKLTNPKPPGFIHTDGRFGPWNLDEPSQTPVAGDYTFRDADLGVFHGISGTLSSDGKYMGELDRIEVNGAADAPNFALTNAHREMPLHTTFSATVDGTNGNTTLHPVRATLGRSRFDVSGTIERHALEEHKTIALEASGAGDRIQDFLELAMEGTPPMTGGIAFRAHVTIPPGEAEVVNRLELNGSFDMAGIHFTSQDVDRKLASLSNHALGKPKASDNETVTADLSGRFRMQGGRIILPAFRFDIPGAAIALHGTYAIRTGDIDMTGQAKLEATVSQMTTGVKRIFLKPIDPIFRHDGAGTVLPVNIGGTRGKPSFKLDFGRVLKDAFK